MTVIKTGFLYGREPTRRIDRGVHMDHEQKVRAAAALLVKRHGQKAPEVAQRWSRELMERKDPEAAAVCLEHHHECAVTERAPDLEVQYLRERAAVLRDLAQGAMPASIASQLLDVAADLEKRAARLEERPLDEPR